MKKAVFIIGGILVITGIALYAFKKYWSDPKVEVISVDWLAMTAQISVGGKPYTLKDGMGIPLGRQGRVIAFSTDKNSIISTEPNGGGVIIYDTYATRP